MNLWRPHTYSLDVPTWKIKYWCCWSRRILPSSSSGGLLSSQLKVRVSHRRSGRRMWRGHRVRSIGETMLNVKLRGRHSRPAKATAQLCSQLAALACWLKCFALSPTSTTLHTKSKTGQIGIDHALHAGANAITPQRRVCEGYLNSNNNSSCLSGWLLMTNNR